MTNGQIHNYRNFKSPLSTIDRIPRQKISQDTEHQGYRTQLTLSFKDNRYLQNTLPNNSRIHYFQVPTEYVPRKTIAQILKQTPTNFKELKSHKVYSPTTMKSSQKSINRKITNVSPNTWNLSNILNNPWAKKQVSRKLFKYTEMNENENIPYQMQDTAKAAMVDIYSKFTTKCIQHYERGKVSNQSII